MSAQGSTPSRPLNNESGTRSGSNLYIHASPSARVKRAQVHGSESASPEAVFGTLAVPSLRLIIQVIVSPVSPYPTPEAQIDDEA